MMKPLLILQTGDAPPFVLQRHGNFDRMFLRMAGLDEKDVRQVHVARNEEPDPPDHYAGVLITGSPAMVSERADWSEKAAGWLRNAMDADVTLFGACYGHQLLAHALGGKVDYHPDGIELGTLDISLSDDAAAEPLLAGVPARFSANLVHRQSVLEAPAGAVVLARSEHDAHQMLRYGKYAFSTQFHPEFDGNVIRSYVAMNIENIPEQGESFRPRLAQAADTPYPQGILRKFVALAMSAP